MSLTTRNQTYSIAGTSGVAYAGGASSGPVSRSSTQLRSSSLPKEPIVVGARSGKPPSRGESGGRTTGVGRRNTTSCDMDRETWEHRRGGSVQCDPLEYQHPDSPKYLPPLRDPSNNSTSCNLNDRGLQSAQVVLPPPSSPADRNMSRDSLYLASPSRARFTTQSPTGRFFEARVPDKSLPVSEEDDEDGRHGHRQEREARDHQGDLRQHHATSPPSSSLVEADYHGYPHSPHSRPGAPIPPTPHSHTSSPSPLPLILNGVEPVLPPYNPVKRVASPFPYLFGDIRHKIYAGSDNGSTGLSRMDPNVVPEQRVLQWQAYARNDGGMISDSTLSPSSTPFPGPQYNPWTFLRTSALSGRRSDRADSQASTHSSPSHQPVSLPPFRRGYRGPHRRGRSEDSHPQSKTRTPPRVESTQPQDTSPELSSGEETVGDFDVCNHSEPQHSWPRSVQCDASADDEDDADGNGKWIDEDVGIEGVADDLPRFEFHTEYVGDPEKRRQRSKHHWEALLRVASFPTTFSRQRTDAVVSKLHALDRETNITLVLLAAPSHTGKLHSVASKAVRRHSSLKSTEMKNIRSAFAEIVSRQRTPRLVSLLKQLSGSFSSSGDGHPVSSSSEHEEDLCRALNTAISRLHTLGSLYEQQAMNWIEEKHRLDMEKERILLPLKQVLDAGAFDNLAERAMLRRWPTYYRCVLSSLLLLLLVFCPSLLLLRIAGRVALQPYVAD